MISRNEALAVASAAHRTPRQVLDDQDPAAPTVAEHLELRSGKVLAGRGIIGIDPEYAAFKFRLDEQPSLLELGLGQAVETIAPAAAGLVGSDAGSLGETVLADTPIEEHPEFRDTLEAARFYQLGDVYPSALPDALLEVVFDQGLRPSTLGQHQLDALVADAIIQQADADALSRGIGVLRTLDDQPSLVAAASANHGIVEARELVALTTDDWLALIDDADLESLPTDTPEQYARRLARQTRSQYPAATLAHHAGAGLPPASDLAVLDDLVATHGATISIKDDIFEPGTLSDPEVEAAARAIHGRLVGLTRRFRAYAVGDILDGAGTPEDRRAALAAELADVQQLYSERPDALRGDLAGDATAFDDFLPGQDPTARGRMLTTARAFQRTFRLTDDLDDALTLLDAGIDCAFAAVSAGVDGLVELGIPPRRADRQIERARRRAAGTLPLLGELLDQQHGVRTPALGNIDPKLGALFRSLPNYEELFGNQTFCRCQHCRSILSPAAYFVDTLRFVERTVLDKHFDDDSHPLHLKARRPDLWTLPLSCENTHTLVRTLELAVERLEETAARIAHGDDDAAAIDAVYSTTLAQARYGPVLPFERDGERIPLLLAARGVTLADVTRILRPPTHRARVRSSLGLSRATYEAITIADETEVGLKERYGIDFTVDGVDVEAIETVALMGALGVDRERLGALLTTRFVAEGTSIAIELGYRDENSVQYDIEQVTGLTLTALDRLERFARLERALPLEVFELDYLLTVLFAQAGWIDFQAALQKLAWLSPLGERVDATAEELGFLLSPAPIPSLEPGGTSAIDRRFNSAIQRALIDEVWPAPTPIKVTAPDDNDFANTARLVRLAAGLRLDLDATISLIKQLAAPLGVDLQATPPELTLTAVPPGVALPPLEMLLRHATLLRLFGLDPATLIGLLDPLSAMSNGMLLNEGYYNQPDQIAALGDLMERADRTPWTVDEMLAFATAPVADEDDIEAAATAIALIHSDRVQWLDARILASVDGIDESQSRSFVTANSVPDGALVSDSGRFRLAADYASADLQFDAEMPQAQRDAIVALLASLTAGPLLEPHIAEALELPTERLVALLRLIYESEDHPLDGAAIALALHEGAPVDALALRIAEARRLGRLFADRETFTLERLAALRTHRRLINPNWTPDDFRAPRLDMQLRIAQWKRLVARWKALPDGLARLDRGLEVLVADGIGSPARLAGLTYALRCDEVMTLSLCDNVSVDGMEAMVTFEAYVDALALCRTLQVNVSTLLDLTSDDFDAAARTQRAARRLDAAIDIGDSSTWLVRRRDALVTWLLRSPTTPYHTTRDLYAALLIDVEVSGCAETTRVASAIDAVQLYVNRVLLNLEISAPTAADPVAIPPSAIPADQWAWRKNYRVWEANRKVFLYPENYLEPGVRDDQTPLFEAFLESLASREADETAIEDAYAAYLRGFEEVGRLRIGGTYHETGERTDTLHLFGVDSQDPPNWYYRRIDDMYHSGPGWGGRGVQWGAWEQLDLKIPVRRVSPTIHRGRLYIFWVEIATRAQGGTIEGTNQFPGYRHEVRLRFSTQRLDGSWSVPQNLRITERIGWTTETPSVIIDRIRSADNRPTWDRRSHDDPWEQYTLEGWEWQIVHPHQTDDGRLALRGMRYEFMQHVDLDNLTTGQRMREADARPGSPPHPRFAALEQPGDHAPRSLWSSRDGDERTLHSAPAIAPLFDPDAWAWLLIDREHTQAIYSSLPRDHDRPDATTAWAEETRNYIDLAFEGDTILAFTEGVDDTIEPVRGKPQDAILRIGGQLLHLQEGGQRDGRYLLRRLHTGVVDKLGRLLATGGIEHLLAICTQLRLAEPDVDIGNFAHEVNQATGDGDLDFTGPMGAYLREVFFHIPLAIAHNYQAHGRHDLARRWYAFVFDPAADDDVDIDPECRPTSRRVASSTASGASAGCGA